MDHNNEYQVSYPIFVFEENDLSIILNKISIYSEIEPMDVQSTVFTSYDSKGRLLKLEAKGNNIKVYLAEIEPLHCNDLENRLRRYFKDIHEPITEDRLSNLSRLVDLAIKHHNNSKSTFSLDISNIFTINDWLIGCYFILILLLAATGSLDLSYVTNTQCLLITFSLIIGLIISFLMILDIRNKEKRILSILYWIGFIFLGFIFYTESTYTSPRMLLTHKIVIGVISGTTSGILFYLLTAFLLWTIKLIKKELKYK